MARSPTQNYIHISIDAKICMSSARLVRGLVGYIKLKKKHNSVVLAKFVSHKCIQLLYNLINRSVNPKVEKLFAL